MPRPHAPTVTLPHPLMLNPMLAGARCLPVTRHPFMAIADPAPVAAQPDIPGDRRDTNDLLARRRRRNHHHAVGGMPLIGDDDAPGEDGGH